MIRSKRKQTLCHFAQIPIYTNFKQIYVIYVINVYIQQLKSDKSNKINAPFCLSASLLLTEYPASGKLILCFASEGLYLYVQSLVLFSTLLFSYLAHFIIFCTHVVSVISSTSSNHAYLAKVSHQFPFIVISRILLISELSYPVLF